MRNLALALAVCLAACGGCRRTDVRTFAVAVPGLTEADLPAVTAALAPYGGVEPGSVAFDAAVGGVTLRYDSMKIAKKNIEMALAGAGFVANDVTPESIGAERRSPAAK